MLSAMRAEQRWGAWEGGEGRETLQCIGREKSGRDPLERRGANLAIIAVGQSLVCALPCNSFAFWNLYVLKLNSSCGKGAFIAARKSSGTSLCRQKMNSPLGIPSTQMTVLLEKWLHNSSLFIAVLTLNCTSKPLLSSVCFLSCKLRVGSVRFLIIFAADGFPKYWLFKYGSTVWFWL